MLFDSARNESTLNMNIKNISSPENVPENIKKEETDIEICSDEQKQNQKIVFVKTFKTGSS